MSAVGRKITFSDDGSAVRDERTRPEPRLNDMPVRKFLVAGAREGLTVEQMFPDGGAAATDEPGSGA